ncbi:kelch-like protein 15 [Amphiura filiformis]|uniref:kelch-like protein 15 n=1 Tax=Amphiura filiformis TaxID=82378 RepID=UPI003B20BC37
MQNINDTEQDPGPRWLNNDMDTETRWLLDHVLKVCEGLHRLQQTSTFCDITIKVGDTSFEAHKAVLASSSDFFHTMFTSGFQESHASEVSISGKPEAFQILLDFSYSGKLNISPSEITTIMDVLKMAHYLQFNQVVAKCQDTLLQNFDRCNMKEVLQMMSESDVFELPKLKIRGSQYLAENFDGSDDFLQCMTSELIVETLGHKDFNVMDEKKVFDIIVAWLKHDWEARKEFAPLLFQSIRLGAVPSGHITVTFLESPELNSIPECRQMVVRVMQLLDNKKPDDIPVSISHPTLFQTRSTVTAIFNVRHGCFFDAKENCWTNLSKYPQLPRKEYTNELDSCVVANHELYVARGWAPQESRNLHGIPNFVSLDVINKRWKSLAPMTQRRGRCCLVPLGDDHIYAIGGFCGEDEESMKKCEVYSIKEDIWREIPPMPHPVCRVWPNSAVAYEGKILVFGERKLQVGDANDDILFFNVMMYYPAMNTWHHLGNYGYRLNLGATRNQRPPWRSCSSGLVVQNGKCYRVVGGGSSGMPFGLSEVIIDYNNMRCISNADQRQAQDSIPRSINTQAFRIERNFYMICGGVYHKQDLRQPVCQEGGFWNDRLQKLCSVGNAECVTTFTFDKALLM